MSIARRGQQPVDSVLEAHLLGEVTFDTVLALQQRLVYEVSGHHGSAISLLLCEHPPVITIGRLGSRAHLRATTAELNSRQIELRWVNRGGGTILHSPGQLAVYPVVSLAAQGWTVGEFLGRFQDGLEAVLADVGLGKHLDRGALGLSGRTGQLVSFGLAVKSWTSYYGAYINVHPSRNLARLVQSDPDDRIPASSLMIERQSPVKMTSVRAAVIARLAESFGTPRHHVYSGHPLLSRNPSRHHESARRAV
jgi:lipoyl(octanoyl) transferase